MDQVIEHSDQLSTGLQSFEYFQLERWCNFMISVHHENMDLYKIDAVFLFVCSLICLYECVPCSVTL